MSHKETPIGFEPLPHQDPFLETIGTFLKKETEQGWIVGISIEEKHCNGRKIAHGGLISTLADVCLAYGCTYSQTPPLHMVTAHKNIDFLGMVVEGQWLEAHLTIRKKGKSLFFADADIIASNKLVARASGVINVLPNQVIN
ncbi:MAG: PaaI family thioesterase [Cellvibrionales bacterium]|nr:PaaI family thioesterase [Cellvibrionales bacterium]